MGKASRSKRERHLRPVESGGVTGVGVTMPAAAGVLSKDDVARAAGLRAVTDPPRLGDEIVLHLRDGRALSGKVERYFGDALIVGGTFVSMFDVESHELIGGYTGALKGYL